MIVIASTIVVVPLSVPDSALAQSAAGGDYVCAGRIGRTPAQLWLRDGKPVKYKAKGDKLRDAELFGDTIFIDAATLSNVVIGQTANGQKVVQGDWELGSYRRKGVLFKCTPE